MYRVSGLDKLDAIEILVSTTKIQAIGKIKKCLFFLSWQVQDAVLPGEALIEQGEQLNFDELFWFGGCIIQNSLQNAAMLMVLLLLLLLHPNRAKWCSKKFSCSLQGSHLEPRQNLKQSNVLFL